MNEDNKTEEKEVTSTETKKPKQKRTPAPVKKEKAGERKSGNNTIITR